MAVEISSTLLERMLTEASADAEREVCGLLFGTARRITAVRPCRNVASDPAIAFEIDPAQLIAAHRAARDHGPAVIGCYHSHPGGRPVPSPRDAAAAPPDGAIWLILAGRRAGCYRAVDHGRIEDRFDAVLLSIVAP